MNRIFREGLVCDMRTFFAIIFVGMIVACSKSPVPSPPKKTETPKRRLVIPNGEVPFTIKQRTTQPLPGSQGRILLTIDDITRGQVIASISTNEGKSVMSPVSVSGDDVVRFELDDRTYTITVEELRNELIGDDTAVFTLREGAARTEQLTENEKIEQLIKAISELRNAVHIRNDKEHTSAEAAEHLMNKWKWKASEIKTAEDFIRLIAAKSSVTGLPYVIRFPDGREIESVEFLKEELEKMEMRKARKQEGKKGASNMNSLPIDIALP